MHAVEHQRSIEEALWSAVEHQRSIEEAFMRVMLWSIEEASKKESRGTVVRDEQALTHGES